MSRPYFVAGFAVGALLLVNCDKAPSMGPNTSIFGEPERVAGQLAGSPAETVCQKFESCGLFSQTRVSPPQDRSDLDRSDLGLRAFGITAGAAIGRQVYAQASPFGPASSGDSIEQPQTLMGICIKQVDDVIKQFEDRGSVSVDWASLGYCIAAGSCDNFYDEDGWQRLGLQCAGQLGIDLGSTSTPKPPKYPDPQPRDDAGPTDPPDPPSGDVCEEAASKLKACIDGLDCSSFEGTDQSICEALKSADTSEIPACEGETRSAAEQINSCNLDELCRCQV